MDKYKMTSFNTDIKVYYSIEEALAATEDKIRVDLQGKRLKTMPKGFEALAKIPYLELDLSYNTGLQIDSVLEQLKQLPNLRGLALMRIEFGALPSSIGDLVGLETLILWGNKMKKLPPEIENLKELRYLILRTNPIGSIQKEILTFKKLEYLEMSYTSLMNITPAFCKAMADNLKELIVKHCVIKELPAEIGLLTKLKTLHVSDNKLKVLPEEIKQLENLESFRYLNYELTSKTHILDILSHFLKLRKLDLTGFHLEELPDFVTQMTNLKELNVTGNSFKSFPESLGDLPKLKRIDFGHNPNFEFEKLWKSINDGKYKALDTSNLPKIERRGSEAPFFVNDIEELHLNLNDYPIFPVNIIELKRLRRLSISYYSSNQNEKSALTELPDIFDQLEALEYLYISHLHSLEDLPPSIYKCKTINNISLSGDIHAQLNFEKLAQMPNLESFGAKLIDEDIEKVPLLKNLNRIGIVNETCHFLPQEMTELTKLTSFNFDTMPNLAIEDAISKLPFLTEYSVYHTKGVPKNLYQLQYLKKVDIFDCEFQEMLTFIEKSDSIEDVTVQIKNEQSLANILVFNKLKAGKISNRYDYHSKAPINLPLEFILLDTEKININEFYRIDIEKKKAEIVKKMNLPTDQKNKLAFGLLLGRFDEIKDLLTNPFENQVDLKGVCIYIFGIPTFSTLKELRANLENRGATIAKDLDDAVTHILLSSKIKDDIEVIMKANKPFILEDYFKTQVFSEDMPYLMEEANEELTEQITRMLHTGEAENIELVLELIEGGGANKKLIGYLLAIHLRHDDLEIRKKSRTLFRKYASATLQIHVKNKWKDSWREKGFDLSFLDHPEIGFFEAILADKIVNKFKGTYNAYYHEALSIQEIPTNIDLSVLKYFDFIKRFHLVDNGITDYNEILSFWANENLTSIYIQGFKQNNFPIDLDKFNNIEEFEMYKDHNITENIELEIPIFQNRNNLKRLCLNNFNIQYLDGFKKSTQLSYVSVNGLQKFPSFLLESSKISNLYLQGEFENKCYDFGNMKNLSELSIDSCNLEVIEDSFYECKYLKEVSFYNAKITKLPFSLFQKAINRLYNTSEDKRINMGNGNINEIMEAPENLPVGFELTNEIYQLNLEDNKIKKIPDFFAKITFNKLILNKNPIKELPNNFSEFQFKSYGSIELNETDITELSLDFFKCKVDISVSNHNAPIKVPKAEDIAPYKGRKSIYWKGMTEEDKENIAAIYAKRLK